MISEEMNKMINQQINAEIWSSYLYLSMSLQAELIGYRGVANWFLVQSREELDHSRMLQKYLMAQESAVKLLPIHQVQTEWATPLEMFVQALEHERSVTKMIHTIMRQAQSEHDYATCSRMTWFIDEQVEEEETCTELVQRLEQAAQSPCYFMQIDYELQNRQYKQPLQKRDRQWFGA